MSDTETYVGTRAQPRRRPAKVTGAAKYAAEFDGRGPGAWLRRVEHDRQGSDHAHRYRGGAGRPGVLAVLHP